MKYSEAKQYLKEGMKVKLIKHSPDLDDDCDGRIFILSGRNSDGESWPTTGGHWFRRKDELEILTNPDGSKWVHPKKQDQKFKVGDRVKIIKHNWTGAGNSSVVGKSGQITLVISGDKNYQVHNNEDYLGIYNDDELEKIEEPKTAREVMMNIAMDNIAQMNHPPMFVDPEMLWGKSLLPELKVTKNYFGTWASYQEPKRKTFMSSATEFVKKQALKLNNPDEFELREAGLHDSCGDLTSDGEALRDQFLEELVHAKLVETAKAINTEKKEKK